MSLSVNLGCPCYLLWSLQHRESDTVRIPCVTIKRAGTFYSLGRSVHGARKQSSLHWQMLRHHVDRERYERPNVWMRCSCIFQFSRYQEAAEGVLGADATWNRGATQPSLYWIPDPQEQLHGCSFKFLSLGVEYHTVIDKCNHFLLERRLSMEDEGIL